MTQTIEEGLNLAEVVAADPTMKKNFFTKLADPQWEIPDYEPEIRALVSTQVSLIPTISSPDDYKILIQALSLVVACKERAAVVTHHLKALNYRWSKLLRQAQRYVERRYYTDLNSLKDSIRKSVLSSALDQLEEGVAKLKYLLDLAESAQSHLSEVNWAVKNSCEMVTSYFNVVRSVTPSTPKDL